jgi:phospholipid/cholesterol/gamma-HCH transport system substrate-binding protein
MKRFDTELMVGIFFLIGLACLAYLSIKLGRMEVIGNRGTTIYAKFTSVGGLKSGASVEIAGVEIGRVKSISLDLNDYMAKVVMLLRSDVKIQEDAMAAVKTKGLIGEKYVEITPGASDKILKNGGMIRDTQPPFDLSTAIGKMVFGNAGGESGANEGGEGELK